MVRIGVTGATGHMAREVMETAGERGDDVVVAVSESTASATRDGVSIDPAADLPDLLASERPDVLVDFTVPESSVRYVEACADAGVPAVVGTTGFSEEEYARLREASGRVAVLKAANFARGIHALIGAVREAVETLPGYDVELTETHHNRKRDAPSGTAKTILSEISAAGTGMDEVYGREGTHPRRDEAVGVHVRRAGDVRGEHEVMLADNDEVLTLAHRAESRAVFAAGALDAAEWLAGRAPGFYEFGDALEDGDSADTERDSA